MVVTTARPPAVAAGAATAMRVSGAVVLLSSLLAVLALLAAGVGLFWVEGGGPIAVTSIRGQVVQLYGRGVYSMDTLFKAGANRGSDVVTLLLGLPLLAVCTALYRRGSLRGGLLLIGTIGYFLYTYASIALGAAYNGLFLVYIALFSASLFGFVLAFASVDQRRLASHISGRMPRRWIAGFMILSGLATTVIWLGPLLGAIAAGAPPPKLETSTTSITDLVDLGVITPATILSGVLILRRDALGYVIAFALIVLEVLLAPMIVAQTIFQLRAGIAFSTAEIVGPICGFVALALIALWALVTMLRNISERGALDASS